MGRRSPLELGSATLRRARRIWGNDTGQPLAAGAANAMLELARSGPAPTVPCNGSPDDRLKIAAVIPSFRRGSGGHRTIVRLLGGLSELGHEVSMWLEDHEGRHVNESRSLIQGSFAEFFGAEGLALHPDLRDWTGADLVLATGWQTVPRTLMLPNAATRAYLVQDHEPDFYPASAEALWAAQTYRMGLRCVAASQWLAQLLQQRYDASATHFDLGVDRSVYTPGQVDRRPDLVVFYARAVTPRRAVPLGLATLSELAARRPEVEIALFGEDASSKAASSRLSCSQLGVLGETELAELYSRATVGLVFSLTNPSLINLEMMACGLPCIELASASMTSSFPSDGPLQLVEPDPIVLCAAVERLLEDPAARDHISKQGVELTEERSWRRAAQQVEAALREALSEAITSQWR